MKDSVEVPRTSAAVVKSQVVLVEDPKKDQVKARQKVQVSKGCNSIGDEK